MKVALYARVSTADKGQDPRVQTLELKEYCERRGWGVAGEYVDIGFSGTKEKRPELDRLIRALETFRALGIDFRLVLGATRHQYTDGKNGLHRLGCSGRARAKLDRRARQGRNA